LSEQTGGRERAWSPATSGRIPHLISAKKPKRIHHSCGSPRRALRVALRCVTVYVLACRSHWFRIDPYFRALHQHLSRLRPLHHLENNIVQTTARRPNRWPRRDVHDPCADLFSLRIRISRFGGFSAALLGGMARRALHGSVRRQLIVKEHGNSHFPKALLVLTSSSPAKRGAPSRAAFFGTPVSAALHLPHEHRSSVDIQRRPTQLVPRASFRAPFTSEYWVSAISSAPAMSGFCSRRLVSWLVMMPAIKFYGQLAGNTPNLSSTISIPF